MRETSWKKMAGRVAEDVMEQEIKNEMKQRILAELDMSQEIDDMEVRRLVDQCIMEYKGTTELPLPARIKLRKELFNTVRRMDVLSEFLEDESVTEIMINGYDNIFIERSGRVYRLIRHLRMRNVWLRSFSRSSQAVIVL